MAGTPHYMLRTVETVIYASRAGEERRNVIHYRYAGARPNAGQLNALNNEVADHIINAQQNLAVIGTVWYQVVSTDVEDNAGLVAATPITRAATGGTNVMPGSVSHCLTKRTAERGRSKRGRFYLFDLDEAYFNGDDMNPLYIPVATGLCNEIMASRVSGYFIAAVGSRTLGGSTPITAMTFDLIADTQVRRGKGRGR